jgi:hypothetical protein
MTPSSLQRYGASKHPRVVQAGWSVLVQGVASEVRGPGERNAALAVLAEPWGVAGVADRVVRIDMRTISGRGYGSLTAPKAVTSR